MTILGPIRRLAKMIFGPSWRFFSFGRHEFRYAREVGDPMASSTVAAPVLWFARNFPEAPPALWRQLEGGEEEREVDHPLLRLLLRPNEHYTGSILWWATTIDWNVNGEGYWIVIPNRAGTPLELWYTPSWTIFPVGDDNDPSVFVKYYEYRVGGGPSTPVKLDPQYVIHFRYGLDPNNPRRGTSPLRSVLREIFTDNEAASFTASLLRNMGVPGIMVSPESGITISDEQAEEAKESFASKFTGDKRGEPIVMTGATKIEQFGFNPQELLLKELRRIPEERVSAVTGVPAVVAGLGAGLDRSTFTNMAEAREAAYESGLIPAQKILGEEIRFQLLTLFGEDPFAFRFGFDLSKVRVLQEDLFRQAQRHDVMVQGGWETIGEARRGMGMKVNPDDDVYLRDSRKTIVPAQGGEAEPLRPYPGTSEPIPTPNGNGALSAEEIADEVERRLNRRELTKG